MLSETRPDPAPDETCVFLDKFPAELRNRIYIYCIVNANEETEPVTEHVRRPFREQSPALFRTCRQIHKESRQMHEHEKTIHLEHTTLIPIQQIKWLRSIGRERAAKFRSIRVSISAEGVLEMLPSLRFGGAKVTFSFYNNHPGLHRELGTCEFDKDAARTILLQLAWAGFAMAQVECKPPSMPYFAERFLFAEKIFLAYRAVMGEVMEELKKDGRAR
ncbi:hypothetical protein MBLNU230_g0611t1 [Neophaeotheca triangularis]